MEYEKKSPCLRPSPEYHVPSTSTPPDWNGAADADEIKDEPKNKTTMTGRSSNILFKSNKNWQNG
jgi:hypothetical protein